MKYRKFGLLNWEASVLGFDVTCLPAKASATDEEKSIALIRKAIEKGVNYIDIADSGLRYEERVRIIDQALKDGYREKVKISAGIPVSSISSAGDFDRYLNKYLKRMNMEKIDFFFLSGIDRITWPGIKEMKLLNCLDKALADSRIGKAGFSFYDHFRYFRDIAEGYNNWTFCRFRYSFMDADRHPGTAGVRYAAKKGLAVVIDEPLLSGRLLCNIPDQVKKLFSEAKTQIKSSPVELGLLWILNHTEVSTVLCDMASIKEIMEYTDIADKSGPDVFTVQELLLVNRIQESYHTLKAVPCTTCRACMPCPSGIDVPRIFELYNEAAMFGNKHIPANLYESEGHNIKSCSSCGKCIKACGRKIQIPERLNDADKSLTIEDKKKINFC
jgi:uncharacterized protein